MGRARVFGSAPGRAVLVLAFVVALAIPLTAALSEVVREARVRGAVQEAAALLETEGVTSILWRQVELGPDSALARVRVATTVGVSEETREEFRRRATVLAGEPVSLRLEQLPASAGGAGSLEALLGGRDGSQEAGDRSWPETVARARLALERAAWSLPFPDGSEAIGVVLRLAGGDPPIPADSAEVTYLAPRALEPQAAEVLGDVLRQAVGHPALRTSFRRAGPAVLVIEPADTAALGAALALLRQYPGLRVRLRSAPGDSLASAGLLDALRTAGVDSISVERRIGPGPIELHMTPAGR